MFDLVFACACYPPPQLSSRRNRTLGNKTCAVMGVEITRRAASLPRRRAPICHRLLFIMAHYINAARNWAKVKRRRRRRRRREQFKFDLSPRRVPAPPRR